MKKVTYTFDDFIPKPSFRFRDFQKAELRIKIHRGSIDMKLETLDNEVSSLQAREENKRGRGVRKYFSNF